VDLKITKCDIKGSFVSGDYIDITLNSFIVKNNGVLTSSSTANKYFVGIYRNGSLAYNKNTWTLPAIKAGWQTTATGGKARIELESMAKGTYNLGCRIQGTGVLSSSGYHYINSGHTFTNK